MWPTHTPLKQIEVIIIKGKKNYALDKAKLVDIVNLWWETRLFLWNVLHALLKES